MDSYKAYLLACLALGALRVIQGWRSSVGRVAFMHWRHLLLEAACLLASAAVLMAAPAPQVQGVALWYLLGTLGGGLLLRPRVHALIPEWYQEYMLLFGLGLSGFAVNALVRYPLTELAPVLAFVSYPTGMAWLFAISALGVFAVYELVVGLLQRSYDRGVLGGLQGDPRCSELFGEIRQIFRKHEESARVSGDDVLVYRVEGSRAAGVVVAEFRETPDQSPQVNEVVQGLVYMDTGERSSLNVNSSVEPS